MADFDDALNNILDNPAAMAQIAQLAQSLTDGNSAQNSQGGAVQGDAKSSPQGGPVQGNPAPEIQDGPVPPLLDSPLLPLIREFGKQRDSNARRLLYALRPYLRPARQEKIERALQLARLYQIAKQFLKKRGGTGNV